MSNFDLINDELREKELEYVNYELSSDIDSRIMICKNKLIEFLNNNVDLKRPKGNKETNIIDIQKGNCYSFTKNTDKVDDFFIYLENCRRNNVTIMFSEKQNPYGSGIMLDFDFKLKDKKNNNQVTILHKLKLLKHIIKIINKYFDLETYLQSNTTNNITVGVTSAGKNNFHLLIPGILLTKVDKYFLIEKIYESDILNNVFGDLNFETSESMLDGNCVNVPVFFIGNTRFNKDPSTIKIPYKLEHVYDVDISGGVITAIPNEEIKDSNRKINICYEFSLNFEKNSSNKLIYKKLVSCKPEYINELNSIKNRIGRKINEIDLLDEIDNSLSILRMSNPEIGFVQSLLDILKQWRSQRYESWRYIVFLLSAMGEDYKPLALHFSMKCSEKFSSESFEKLWNDGIYRKQY